VHSVSHVGLDWVRGEDLLGLDLADAVEVKVHAGGVVGVHSLEGGALVGVAVATEDLVDYLLLPVDVFVALMEEVAQNYQYGAIWVQRNSTGAYEIQVLQASRGLLRAVV